MFQYRSILFALFAMAAASPLSAQASLGGDKSSLSADEAQMHVQRNLPLTKTNYTIHEMENGHAVFHEFLSNDGKVFAVAWSGTHQPDLRALFGSYYAEFAAANQQAVKVRGQRSHASIQTENLVIERYGHIGKVGGRAYLPALMPEGVNASELR